MQEFRTKRLSVSTQLILNILIQYTGICVQYRWTHLRTSILFYYREKQANEAIESDKMSRAFLRSEAELLR